MTHAHYRLSNLGICRLSVLDDHLSSFANLLLSATHCKAHAPHTARPHTEWPMLACLPPWLVHFQVLTSQRAGHYQSTIPGATCYCPLTRSISCSRQNCLSWSWHSVLCWTARICPSSCLLFNYNYTSKIIAQISKLVDGVFCCGGFCHGGLCHRGFCHSQFLGLIKLGGFCFCHR